LLQTSTFESIDSHALQEDAIQQEDISQEDISQNTFVNIAENYSEKTDEPQNHSQTATPNFAVSNSTQGFAAVNQAFASPDAAETDSKTKSISFSEVLELEAWSNRQSLLRRMSLSAWIFAGTVGVFGIVAGIYALTRPCVIGACPPIEQAQQMSDRAIDTIQTTESALAIVEAYNQLREVDGLLSPIPFWSPHYETAQQIIKASEARASRASQIVNALEKANQAAQKSQNPPHPLPQWREIQWLWRDAIAALQRVPPDSPVYDLAQRRLQEYETSLTDINRRVAIEQDAQERVNAARRTAEVAEAQAGIAKTAQDWQQSYAAWQAAVKVLAQIPQGTMAHTEAEQLLVLYQPRLQEANQRLGQESIAENTLRQANQLAEQARSLEQQNQWSKAKATWQQAVENLQRIPQQTVYYTQAQSTLRSYTESLTQAEKNAARLVAMQAVQPDLDRTCVQLVSLCTYSFTPQAIRVQITRSYDQATEQIMTAQENSATQAAIATQVGNLLRSLAAISESAQVPIELYNADGSRFGTYSPEASGFVAQ
jgi:tetratricopeptide (TPR) repeat protein